MKRKFKKPKNPTEGECYDYMESLGWTCSKKGWPDFFCENKETGEICCIEVKPRSTVNLSKDQIIVMTALMKVGIKCYKYTEDKKLVEWTQEMADAAIREKEKRDKRREDREEMKRIWEEYKKNSFNNKYM